jgi:DNA-binding LacI/PurR family transcriptional regulator
MRQIGKLAGVSDSTVSRIISGSDFRIPIAAGTRERVLKIVAELGYTPNPLARALRGARSAMLGLIVREVGDPFFAVAIAAITAEARQRGYSVVLGDAHSRAEEAATLQAALATQHCDGTILLGDLRDESKLWASLLSSNVPLVGLCQGARTRHIPVVNVDNPEGARLVLDYLYQLGHRRIAFVQGGWIGDGRERERAHRAFMRQQKLSLPPGYVQTSDNDLAGGFAATQALLALAEPPTAIFAASDVVALGVLKAAASRGVRVPEQLSVAGFDDIPMAAYAIPSLTTVRQPIDEMARLAVARVLDGDAERGGTTSRLSLVRPTLVARDSCAPPDAAVYRSASPAISAGRSSGSPSR